MRIDIRRIEAAVGIIDPVFLNSPQFVCETLSHELGCRNVLKVETMNPIRCFKGRGTETVLSRLSPENGLNGVVCASAGNLGQALAYRARRRGYSATVAASSIAGPSKIQRMKALNADAILVDGAIEEALTAAADFAAQTGAALIEDRRSSRIVSGSAA